MWNFWNNYKSPNRPLTGFYLILVAYLGQKSQAILAASDLNLADSGVVWILRCFPALQSHSNFASLLFLTIAACLIAAAFPNSVCLRAVAAIGVFLLYSLEASLSFFPRSQSSWILAAIILTLPKLTFPTQLACIQIQIFSTYVCSGIWKLRALLSALFEADTLQRLGKTLPTHMANTWLEGSSHDFSLIRFFDNHEILSSLAWAFAIALQLSFIIPVVSSKATQAFALLACFFHFLALATVGIFFGGQVFLLAWSVYFAPEAQKPNTIS